ncbi:MAG TPA: serine/threonine-protein kinase [Phototrophicaceae bacterium]|nr:serine/threonine-protein kinase [Phototrophicaceae bacterium]
MINYQPGTTIDQYTLEMLAGRGAAGEVWKARDGEKVVAMKFMNPNLIESESAAKHRQRMQREIMALGNLRHPNIPTLFDANTDVVPPYLVMTFVEGETYDKLLGNGSMLQIPLTQRLANIAALGSALDACHARSIIHRDVKPSNMIGIEHPYLIDFGLAIKEVNLNETMRQVGTLLYMTPDDLPSDASADIYSFAIVTYELLFGGHPIFRAEDNALGASRYLRTIAGERIANGEWHVPSKVPPDEIPYDLRQSDLTKLDKVFTKALGDSENRYDDLKTFVADLQAAITIPQDGVVNAPGSGTSEDMPTQLEAHTAEIPAVKVEPPKAEPPKPVAAPVQAPAAKAEPAKVVAAAPAPQAPAVKTEPSKPAATASPTTPVAPYTPPKRVQDQFTVLEVEKERTQVANSRQRLYWIIGAIVIVVIVVVVILVTRT